MQNFLNNVTKFEALNDILNLTKTKILFLKI